ncbi:MAG TPA: acyl-CoA thioesterase/bile acid-CoA:amino acid N-acyltransferase family protein [Candidatus Cybelea sp.]
MVLSVPPVAIVDHPIETTVRANSGSTVHVTLEAQRYGMTFAADATYRVPHTGVLRLSEAAPVSGTYRGANAMGLFWSALPNGPPAKGFTFERDTDVQAIPYRVTASSGTQTATAQGTRFFVADDVERRVVDGPGLIATLYRNKRAGCHPGVVVLGGSEGGVPEEEAAVLASHDLTTLALAYYGAPGLSRSLTNVPIEIVQRGMALLSKDPSVCPGDVALFGGSKGAELALLAASTFGGVRGVVALKPSSVVFSGLFGDSTTPQSSWSYGGKPVPFANGAVPGAVAASVAKQEAAHDRVAYVADYAAQVENNTDAAAIIPVEHIAAPLLLAAGGADGLWPSQYMAEQIERRRAMMTKRYADRLLVFPDAGHLIGIPYLFAKAELAHNALDLGGTAAADEAANEALWPVVVEFLQRN